MEALSWVEQEVSEIAEKLAHEAVARQMLKEANSPNMADTLANYGQQAMGWLNAPGQQGLRYGLAGAGLGGLLGAGSQLLQDPEDRQYGSSALTGALAGGAMGAGAGLLQQNGAGLFGGPTAAKAPTQANPATATPSAETAGPSEDLQSQIDAVTSQIAETGQGQTDQFWQGQANKARTGGLAAGGTLFADLVAGNSPRRAILNGTSELKNNLDGNMSVKRDLDALPGRLGGYPLNKAYLRSYFEPRWRGFFGDAPAPAPTPGAAAASPLDELLSGASQAAASKPRKQLQFPFQIIPDRLAQNRHIPVTNDTVRGLYSSGRAGLRPSRTGLIMSALAGLSPWLLSGLGGNPDQIMQQLRQGLNGGSQ